jgi:hypothetical protein
MTRQTEQGDRPDNEHDDAPMHLDGVEDGCGCAEVWEHLSEQREPNT